MIKAIHHAVFLVAAGLLLGLSPLWAAENAAGKYLLAMKGGLLAHDIGVFGNRQEDGADFNLEFIFVTPNFLAFLWSPHPHLGLAAHSRNQTNQLYAGLTWEKNLSKHFFVDLALGVTLHDGNLDCSHPSCRGEKDLGSPLLFREALEVGWRFAQHYSISLILSHISNAYLAAENDGMDHVGIRLGYHF